MYCEKSQSIPVGVLAGEWTARYASCNAVTSDLSIKLWDWNEREHYNLKMTQTS